MLISGPDRPVADPLRALAFVLAACADRWDSVVRVHQQTLARHPPTTAFRDLADTALELLRPLVEQQARLATEQADAVLHAVVQPGCDAFASSPQVLVENGERLLVRLTASDEATRRLLEARYRHQLSGEMLAQQLGIPVAGLATALAEARLRVDVPSPSATPINLGPLPTLFEDYLTGNLDPDSRALLVRLMQDLAGLARFQRQYRLHLLLCAAFAHLPFPLASRASDQASNRTRVRSDSARLSPPRRSSDAQRGSSSQRTNSRTPMMWSVIIVGGCLVGAAGLFLLLGDGPARSGPRSPATPTTTVPPTTPVPSATLSGSAPQAPATPPVSTAPPPAAVSQQADARPATTMPASTAINLLTLVDPARDADGDGWLLSDGQLRNRIEPGKLSYLQLPYRPPAEYDLTIRYRRLDEMGGMVGVILPYNGTQVMAYLSFRAWEQKKLMGLGQVGRLGIVDPPNPTRVSVGGGDQHGRPYQGVIRVRRDRIRIEYEGFTSEWTPAAGELSLEPAWRKIAPGAFALAGGRGSAVFEQVTLLPISGTGEERRPTQPVRETTRALDGATP